LLNTELVQQPGNYMIDELRAVIGMNAENREGGLGVGGVVSTLTPPKSGDVGELVGLGLRRSHDSHQVHTSLLMDIPALRQRQGLIAVQLGA
jgi:hypothetical protein